MDVNSAFLNGQITEKVYVSQPTGFIETGKESLVWKLNKSMYGLKQSPKCWNDSLDAYLKSLEFIQSSCDSCIYTKMVNNSPCYVA